MGFQINTNILIILIPQTGQLSSRNNDKLCSFKYSYTVELLYRWLKQLSVINRRWNMRIVAVILVGFFSISNVYAIDNGSMIDSELIKSNYIIFAEEEKPLEEEPDCE